MKKVLFAVLFILFMGHLLFRIYEYRSAYTTHFDPNYYKLKFENSQWSTKPACENTDPHVNPYTCVWDDQWYEQNKNNPTAADLKRNPIGDDILYTYAGWEYIQGKDPTLLNAELPPFGKYLIGLSIVLFNNQNIFALFSIVFALFAFYLLNTQVFKNKLYAFIPVVLLSLEPLFYTQMKTTLLDVLYFGLGCMTLYFVLKKQFIPSAISLGLMAATKATASTFPIVIAVVIGYLFITKQKELIKKYIFSLPIAGLVFLISYIQYFLLGNSIISFLGVQKWILNFYANGAKGSIIAPWEMVFTGGFANWFGGQSVVSEWHIGWPILFVVSLFAGGYILYKYHKKPVLLIVLWTFLYFLFLSFIPLWSRYFLLILPFMYTLCTWLIVERINKHEIK